MTSSMRLARIAGILYLINAIFSGFAFAYVLGKVFVAGDAAKTAANVAANPGLVRVGVVADLFQGTEWILLALTLYILLKHVHLSAARAMLVLVSVGAAIVCLNDVFQFESVRVATDGSYAAALGGAGSNALVLLLLDIHHYGFLAAQIFFGLWLVPFGYLAYRSTMFPKALGAALIVGGVCYLVGLLAVFLLPGGGERINTFVTIPSAIAELSMAFYLVLFGVRPPKLTDRSVLAAA
ncbi:MAG TPA: DUF4386 domain-containing protein [Candidatus Sulfotelmatobacter sp.]|nr:DUF4386 domain-containing protein [Candidatus Sulfotelmatobacter sp.]